MADPSAIVPYINDPYNEEEEEEDIQVNFMDDSNPTLADLSMPMHMHERNFDDAHALMANANHLFQQDPFLWKWNPGTPQTRSNSGAGAGASNVNVNVNVEPTPTDPFYLNLNMEMRPLSTWPVSPIPFNCTYCHVLREIIFTNGILLFFSFLFISPFPFLYLYLYILSVIVENFINFISCS